MINSKVRKEDDKKYFNEALRKLKLNQNVQIRNVIRLGKKREESQRPRLMKVMFENEQSRDVVLANVRYLKDAYRGRIPSERIYLNPDLNPTEREAEEFEGRTQGKTK